ncbi:hypothetical protein [Pseudomonas viridiflava]|uniref:hypothetical protein n=1 Tax=Pseudomonas viridiflava TaxID=33069 RepID=UPI000F082A8F|nr:hypothetical protein [Pseudomonas viridiflava]
MDDKNLAVLQQLRESMQTQVAADPSETPLSVSWLKILARSLTDPEPKKLSKTKKRKASKAKPQAVPTPKPINNPASHKKQRQEILETQKLRVRLKTDKSLAAQYRDCRECNRPVHVGENIPLSPIRCEHCRSRDGQFDLGLRSSKDNIFTDITVVHGGAPGLGKRS